MPWLIERLGSIERRASPKPTLAGGCFGSIYSAPYQRLAAWTPGTIYAASGLRLSFGLE
jgi:hypothetical protein